MFVAILNFGIMIFVLLLLPNGRNSGIRSTPAAEA